MGVLLIDILPHRDVELAVALRFFAAAAFALHDGLRVVTTPGRPMPCERSCGVAVAGGQGLLRYVNVSVVR